MRSRQAAHPAVLAPPCRSARHRAVALALAGLATAGLGRAAAEDVIITRDGARRVGRLTSCVGEVCMLGGRPLPRGEIAWIGLGQTGEPPARGAATVREDGAATGADLLHLADGATVTARVVGISLGVVATEAGSHDRAAVAWIRFAGAAEALPDRLLLRGGEAASGALEGCTATSCTFGGRPYPRDEVDWIGLATGEAPPPPPAGEGEEVHLIAGEVVPGRVLQVGAGEVVAERGRFRRDEVAWIRLVSETGERGDLPDQIGAPLDDPAPPEGGETGGGERDQEPPEPEREEAPQPPLAPPGARGEGQRGTLWIGTITGHAYGVVDGWTTDWTFEIQARLRERRFPLECPVDGRMRRVGTFAELEPEGSVIANRVTCSSGDLSCSGTGIVTVSAGRGITGIGHASAMWLKSVDGTPSCWPPGGDVERGGGIYQVGIAARSDDQFPVEYRGPDGASTVEHGFLSPPIGGGLLVASGAPPPLCGDREVRRLEGGGAVMRGSWSGACEGCCPQVAVSWSICREGTSCPPPPALPGAGDAPPEEDPCDHLGDLPALRDTCRAQLDARVAELAPHLEAYNALMAQAEGKRDAFAEADLECEIWEQAEGLLKTILTGGAGRAGEAGRALIYLTEVIAKAQKGELHSLLYPDEVGKFLKYYGMATDMWTELTADEVTLMQRRLQQCVGKVDNETLSRAEDFVADLAAAKALWQSEVAPGLNDLRSKGLECADRDHKVWRACLEEAECRGTPAADCGPEPSLGGP